jgi:hypothetical protein
MSYTAPDLVRICDALSAGESIGPDEVAVLVAHVRQTIPTDPGPRARGKARDDLLRQAARTFFPGQSFRAQAVALHRQLSLYQTTAWRRHERTLDECPAHHIGKITEAFWRSLRLVDHVPSVADLRRKLREVAQTKSWS